MLKLFWFGIKCNRYDNWYSEMMGVHVRETTTMTINMHTLCFAWQNKYIIIFYSTFDVVKNSAHNNELHHSFLVANFDVYYHVLYHTFLYNDWYTSTFTLKSAVAVFVRFLGYETESGTVEFLSCVWISVWS